jgi:CRP/FNR family transcriptional regulator, nitrogen oxide reductase regulator
LRRVQPSSLFLRDLAGHDLQRLAENASLETYPARANVFQAGEPANHFHLILAGVWKAFQEAETGQIANLAFVSTGQVVGVHSVLGFSAYSFSVEAVVPTTVLIWPAKTLRTFVERTPNVMWNLCEILSRWISEFSDRYRELLTESVSQRIAHALIRLGEQFGRRKGTELVIEAPLSLEDLAGYAGTTLFTVSRVLNLWQRAGLLHRNRSFVVVHNLESLKGIVNNADVTSGTRRVGSGGSGRR